MLFVLIQDEYKRFVRAIYYIKKEFLYSARVLSKNAAQMIIYIAFEIILNV